MYQLQQSRYKRKVYSYVWSYILWGAKVGLLINAVIQEKKSDEKQLRKLLADVLKLSRESVSMYTYIYTYGEHLHRLSERRASLGIIWDQFRGPLNVPIPR